MAVLKNMNETDERAVAYRATQKIDKAVFEFLDSTLGKYDKNDVTLYNGNPVFFSPEIEIQKGTAFSCACAARPASSVTTAT